MPEELPEIKITFPDGSTWEAGENQRKAFAMKIQEDHFQKAVEKLVSLTEKHWENKTVPTKFNWDESWFDHFKDQLRWDDDVEWFPETGEIKRKAEERINWDSRVKEIIGENWEHEYPRSYTTSDNRRNKDDYPKPFQVKESEEVVQRNLEDDLSLPEVDEPTLWSNERSLKYLILPSDLYEEWENLIVERMEEELEVQEEIDEKAQKHLQEKENGQYFDDMADLADKVFYYNFRAAMMSLAMSELDEEHQIEIIGLSDDRISYYKGENAIHYDTRKGERS